VWWCGQTSCVANPLCEIPARPICKTLTNLEVEMDSFLLMQQAELLRIYIEVEGMRAANMQRESCGEGVAYPESLFTDAAAEVQGVYNLIRESR